MKTIRLALATLHQARLQFLRELKRDNLTDQQRSHYHTLVAEWSTAADELEEMDRMFAPYDSFDEYRKANP